MSEIVRRPTRVASVAAVVAALLAVGLAGLGSRSGLVVAALGALGLAAGLARGNRRAVDGGCLLAFVGVVIGGLGADAVEPTVIATVATVVAWDLGQDAVDLGDQLGREASTARLEGVHVFSSVLVGLLSATLGYAVYVFAADGQPVAVVVFLLLAACFVTMGLGTRGSRE